MGATARRTRKGPARGRDRGELAARRVVGRPGRAGGHLQRSALIGGLPGSNSQADEQIVELAARLLPRRAAMKSAIVAVGVAVLRRPRRAWWRRRRRLRPAGAAPQGPSPRERTPSRRTASSARRWTRAAGSRPSSRSPACARRARESLRGGAATARLGPAPRRPGGEALVEPHLRPALERDAVAEPLVGELVGHEHVVGCLVVNRARLGLERIADLWGLVDDRADVVERIRAVEAPNSRRIAGILRSPGADSFASRGSTATTDGDPRAPVPVEPEVADRRRREVGRHRVVLGPAPGRPATVPAALHEPAVGDRLHPPRDRDPDLEAAPYRSGSRCRETRWAPPAARRRRRRRRRSWIQPSGEPSGSVTCAGGRRRRPRPRTPPRRRAVPTVSPPAPDPSASKAAGVPSTVSSGSADRGSRGRMRSGPGSRWR